MSVIPAHSAGALLCHRPNANVDNIGNDVFLSLPRTADSNDVKLMQEIERSGKSNTAPLPAKRLYCNEFVGVKN